jgi:hypothetical protein
MKSIENKSVYSIAKNEGSVRNGSAFFVLWGPFAFGQTFLCTAKSMKKSFP